MKSKEMIKGIAIEGVCCMSFMAVLLLIAVVI